MALHPDHGEDGVHGAGDYWPLTRYADIVAADGDDNRLAASSMAPDRRAG